MASGASAQETPRVYIVSVPMEAGIDAEATRAGAAARAALRGIEGVDWRSPDQRFLGYDDAALGILDRAREQCAQPQEPHERADVEADRVDAPEVAYPRNPCSEFMEGGSKVR